MPSLLTLIPSGISFLLIFTSAVRTATLYLKKEFPSLAIISLGLFFTSIVPFSFFVFSFVQGSEYEPVRTWAGRSALIFTLMGLMLIAIVFWLSSWEEFKIRYYVLTALIMFSNGMITLGYFVEWDMSKLAWNISYQPGFVIAFIGISTLWISVELVITTYKNYLEAPSESKFPYLLIFSSWVVSLLSSAFFAIERFFISPSSTFYLVIASVGFLLLALGLQQNPLAMMRRGVNAQYFILSERDSGVPLITYEFKNRNRYSQRNILFSSAMQGVLSMLAEVTGQEDLPPTIGYANFTIMLEYSKHYVCYLVTLYDVTPARVIMKQILEEIEHIYNNQEGKIKADQLSKIEDNMRQELLFIT